MKQMLKSWDFWKPIVKFLSAVGIYLFMIFGVTPTVGMYVCIIALIGFFVYGLYMMGKASYKWEEYQRSIGKK